MTHPEFFRIAATKTSDPKALEMLARLTSAAEALALADAAFADRINANKAKRSESPTKLGKAKRQQLEQLAQDQLDLDAQLCDDFRRMTQPSEIVFATHYALTQDLANSRNFLKYYHPDDLALGEEIVHLKQQLLEAATAFLNEFPVAAD